MTENDVRCELGLLEMLWCRPGLKGRPMLSLKHTSSAPFFWWWWCCELLCSTLITIKPSGISSLKYHNTQWYITYCIAHFVVSILILQIASFATFNFASVLIPQKNLMQVFRICSILLVEDFVSYLIVIHCHFSNTLECITPNHFQILEGRSLLHNLFRHVQTVSFMSSWHRDSIVMRSQIRISVCTYT